MRLAELATVSNFERQKLSALDVTADSVIHLYFAFFSTTKHGTTRIAARFAFACENENTDFLRAAHAKGEGAEFGQGGGGFNKQEEEEKEGVGKCGMGGGWALV